MGIDRPLADVNCRWCGLTHGPRCPMVKALDFADDGATVLRVEFFSPRDFNAEPIAPPEYPKKTAG